ncbi:hypothetical protein JYT83_01140 [bacterium AH-315-F18]|nr:hypothetical protein [bacterium AH-315-F18]
MNILVEIGRVSKHIKVVEVTIRARFGDPTIEEIAKMAIVARFGRRSSDAYDEDDGDEVDYYLQGHIENVSGAHLEDIAYDVSYYSGNDQFLGLTKSKFLDDDDMEPGDQLPIDLQLEIPEETARCVFNVRAKGKGWFSRKVFG